MAWQPANERVVEFECIIPCGQRIPRFTETIQDLRNKVADVRSKSEDVDVMDGHPRMSTDDPPPPREHPILTKHSARTPSKWIHIVLNVVDAQHPNEIKATTTLAARGDDLYVMGFRNIQKNKKNNNNEGVWYALYSPREANNNHQQTSQPAKPIIKEEYRNAKPLGWGVKYREIMNVVGGSKSSIITAIRDQHLGDPSWPTEAVRRLSCYRDETDGDDEHRTRMALAGLIVMFCESARMDPLRHAVAGGWGWRFKDLHMYYIWNWRNISYALLHWKYINRHGTWPSREDLGGEYLYDKECSINTENDALRVVRLVRNLQPRRNNTPVEAHGDQLRGVPVDAPSSNGQAEDRQRQGGVPAGNAHSSNTFGQRTVVSNSSTGRGQQELADGDGNNNNPAPAGHGPVPGNAARGRGRPRVEIVAVHVYADYFRTVGSMTITVFDGRQGQIIFCSHKEQDMDQAEEDEKGLVKLVLTGPYTGIAAYGNFAIEVDFPTGEADGEGGSSTSSSAHAAVGPITWEWDSYDKQFASEVDVPEPRSHLIKDSEGRRVLQVYYLVMSNALEATVQIKLKLTEYPEKDGDLPNEQEEQDLTPGNNKDDGYSKYTAHGIIAARIGGLEQHHQIVLFSCTPKAKGKVFIPHSSILPLARSLLAVPYGKPLHLEAKDVEIIDTCSNQVVKRLNFNLSFDCGPSNPTPTNRIHDDDEVEVNVSWYPEQDQIEMEVMEPDKVCIIGDDDKEFTRFIEELRTMLANHNHEHPKDVLEGYPGTLRSGTRNHLPVLARPCVHEQPIRVELQVNDDEGTSSTTLAVRVEDLYVTGFMNQSGVWFDLGNPHGAKMLPPQYDSILLGWGMSYRSLLKAQNQQEVVNKLDSARLGKKFAAAAVHMLSRYPDMEDGDNPRLALAGLTVMVCESARMNCLHNAVVGGWNNGLLEFTQGLMGYISNWGHISRALMEWKGDGFSRSRWNKNSRLDSIQEIKDDPEHALEAVALVFNAPPSQAIVIPYTIGDKEGYVKFIEGLRQELANRKNGPPEHIRVINGKPTNPVLAEQQRGKQPDRWIHIQLKAKGNGMATTTLVIRDDNLQVKGFRNQKATWFELCGPNDTEGEMLPKQYRAKKLEDWGVSYSSILALKVEMTLKSTRLGKAFAERAVSRLSRYPDIKDYNDDMPVRLGLAGLIVMICEAARMEPFLRHFAGQGNNNGEQKNSELGAWDRGQGLDRKLVGFIWNWSNMSAALLKRRDNPFRRWDSQCGVDSAEEALDCVHLVLNCKSVTSPSRGAQVEILAVSANFGVLGIKLIDEAQLRHEIYTQRPEDRNNQGDNNEEMLELELTVPGKCISGHEWFGMEVVMAASTSAGDSITWEFKWDCRRQAGGDATELVNRIISLDSWRQIDVTYLVMSNAAEAKAEVKLPEKPKDYLPHEKTESINDHVYTAQGIITAHIGGFQRYPIVLFTSVEPTPLESVVLPLARSAVQVPRGMRLQINMDNLQITRSFSNRDESCSNRDESSSTKLEIKKPGCLSFDFGSSIPAATEVDAGLQRRGKKVDESVSKNEVISDIEVEVNITWENQEKKTIEKEPDVQIIIGDEGMFTASIEQLRRVLADHPDREDALVSEAPDDKGKALLDTAKHPAVLARPCARQPRRLIHIKLVAVAGEETSSTTLAVRDDKCYGVGFKNQSGVWYDLGNQGGDMALPSEYNSVLLDWGVSYKDILHLSDWDQVVKELDSVSLGKEFLMKAVRTLSRYPDVEDCDLNTRLALAGLMIMVCESAKFNHFHKHFVHGWGSGTGFSRELVNYIRNWGHISRALLENKWWDDSELKSMGISGPIDALNVVHLVFNNTDAQPKQGLDSEKNSGSQHIIQIAEQAAITPASPRSEPQKSRSRWRNFGCVKGISCFRATTVP